ncbi:MAG TPA: dihydrofolate reductase family protein [Jatrophihabitantaceae bacterium]|nr:dihydrofolate reductase family protein [Jatrophihabitantaceae bacterium]
MATVFTAMSVSVDGYVAGPDDRRGQPLGAGGDALFRWYSDGALPAKHYPHFRMSAESKHYFDAICERTGAVVVGRHTYDLANGWNGDGPLPGQPTVILTHEAPEVIPHGTSNYLFISEGIEVAINKALAAAGGKDVSLIGSAPVQQALRSELIDEIHLSVVPVLLGGGVRLLDRFGGLATRLDCFSVVDAPGVTHLSYRVRY